MFCGALWYWLCFGARYFNQGYRADGPGIPITMNSARDDDGHGTHVSSIAVGNYVNGVSFLITPEAARGTQQINLYENPLSIASFGASEKGILVCLSAGNRGPSVGTIRSGIPWAVVVASGTVDRWLAGTLTLGNRKTITGWTTFPARAIIRNLPLVYNETLSACDSSELLAQAPDLTIIVCNLTISNTDFQDVMSYLPNSNVRAAIAHQWRALTSRESRFKAAHRTIESAAIQSAMMTTANPLDNTNQPIKDMDDFTAASPLGIGSGMVDPNRALDPGLIYDASMQDLVNLVCSMNFTREQTQTIVRSSYNCSDPSSDLNYPSFVAIFNFAERGMMLTRRFQRTVTNVGDGAATYRVKLEVPVNTTIRIRPETLVFRKKYEKQCYSLMIRYKADIDNQHRDGSITWIEQNGEHTVRSPIMVSAGADNFS
ncbi:hypothetical protein DH2020_035406 [Rehmannia glutinosa]|uniref:Subtilisin-like protease fibronectin type-III domain-containing protein n=1 Tax=Rehmannia glutinosa TaxID=99300 RepID=A0ABR0V6S4_REHGL